MDEKEILAEYSTEAERLELAPGDNWDPRPGQLATDSAGPEGAMKFEQGVGKQTAQFQWYCSWARLALTDGQAEQRALAQLKKFPTLDVWDAIDKNGHALFNGIAEEAAGGELDALADYVADSCEHSDADRDTAG
ncbi:hypothetical protein QNO07_14830 [Streptomyces sp. 549]|uniref:hypothetical protein n=1 Tax=Streptomyces sp. 549 TaxID=3049076 RepID=UPI0024C3934F|nr:hypothetical protein [Streptomyces sp. 549]MDK1474680.1 hypothetical protein [Streptomyces sp. 549]